MCATQVCAVAGHPQIDLADLGGGPLGRRAVAGVPRPAALHSVALIAQAVGHLHLQPGLEHLAHQAGQQAAVAGQLHPLRAGALHQKPGPVLHRRPTGDLVARRRSRHILISRRHDPFRPAAPGRGPSDHARHTRFPSVVVVVAGALGLGVAVRSCARRWLHKILALCLLSDVSRRVWGRQERSCLEGSLIFSTRL